MDNEEIKVENIDSSDNSAKLPVVRRCRSCRWWRDKGWADDEGIGICDNPKVIEQVKMMSEGMISRFVADKSDTRMIAQSLRFSSEFGCIHWSDNGV